MTANLKRTLAKIHRANTARKIEKLEKAIDGLVSRHGYQYLSRELRPEVWQEVKVASERQRKIVRISGMIVVGALVIAGFAVGLVKGIDLIKGRLAEIPTKIVALDPTEVPVPSKEPEGTRPPALETPTNTPTLPPVPTTSPYLWTLEMAKFTTPALPVVGEINYLLDWRAATANGSALSDGGNWKPFPEKTQDGISPAVEYYFTEQDLNLKWEFVIADLQAANDAGNPTNLYQFFVADTVQHSSGTFAFQFQITDLLGIEVPNSLKYGESTATFDDEPHQTAPTWLSLGVYEIKPGDNVHIKVQGIGETSFAADRILAVRLKPRESEMLQVLQSLAPGGTILAVQDAPDSPDYNNNPIKSWNGSMLSVDCLASNWKTVKWEFPGLLQPGLFQAFVFIPGEHATLPYAQYKVNDGEAYIFNQNSYIGVWVPLVDEGLQLDGVSPIAVEVINVPGNNELDPNSPVCEFGLDAVAIVRMP